MNYHDFILPGALVVYTAFEYHRREQAHKIRLELLKRDIEPPVASGGSVLVRIFTYGLAAVLLVIMIGLFAWIGPHYRLHSTLFFLWPASACILLIFVILIIMRDVKSYRSMNKSGRPQ